jgi:hypothetical protein
MNGRTILGVVLALVLVGGAAALGVGIYNAGIAAGLAQAAANEGTTPVVVPAYGYGWGWGGPGFGFGGVLFGILGFLLLLLLIAGLFRAVTFRGRGPGRWGGPGEGPDRFRGSRWESHARELHDEWHRRGDAAQSAGPAAQSAGPAAPAS